MPGLKIGFAGRWAPSDKQAWSGTYFHAHQAIQKHFETELFFYQWPWRVREYLLLHKQFQKALGKKAAVEFLTRYAKYFSGRLEKDLNGRKVDVLFVPSAPQLIAFCKTTIPIIYLTDATFQQLQGYYPSFSGMAGYNIREGIEMDKRAFENAAHCMVASEWTRQSAIRDYGIPVEKISVVPLGANLEAIPENLNWKKPNSGTCRLLFIGVEWERKGGQIAMDTFDHLQKQGIAATLTIIGSVPPGYGEGMERRQGLTIIPFLDKHEPGDARKLDEIYRNSDFLLLPTRAECAGVVFSEASAYGIPSVTTQTGGVSSYVQEGINGFALPLTATAADYAARIRDLLDHPEQIRQLSDGSRKYYEENLNWDSWGKEFKAIVEKITAR
ncbi:MAG: glycosyltransferase family 4 protein [Chitinophagaceae bacterium]|nr:glycosyltransferase family 4 protein [Chitinophagaceae bacterium]